MSLLATTTVDFANSTDGKVFRCHTAPMLTRKTGEILSALKMGSGPSATLKGTLSRYNFSFGYRKRFSEIPGRSPFNVITFNIYDISGEDVAIIKQISRNLGTGSDLSLIEDLPQNLELVNLP